MSIEDPRISVANDDFSFEESSTGIDLGTPDASMLVAQADTGIPEQIPAPDFPRTLTIGPDGAVRLPMGVVLGALRVDGADLILVQADGSEIVIIDGALRIPAFIIGEVEIPQEVLLAALDASGIDVAAGPDGSFSATGGPQGRGANFDLPPSDDTEDEGPSFTDLLGDTSFAGGEAGGEDLLNDETNVAPEIVSGPHIGGAIESVDNPGGVDADPVPVSGTIVFNDFNAADTHTIEISGRSLESFTGTGTLTPAQVQALLDGFTLGATNPPSGGANGSIAWLYALGNDAVDFLAAGERVNLVFTVTINDAQSSTSTTVAITVTGTNDIPVFENTAAPITYTEGDAAGISESGSITFTDADLSDTHGVDAAISTIAWKNATSDNIDFNAYPELDFDALSAALESAFAANLGSAATNGNTGSIDWTFDALDGLFDFLAKDETLVIEYGVTVDDGKGGTVTTPVTVTVTGTNDAPVVEPDEKRWTESEVHQTGGSGNALSINVLENDSDVDVTDVLSVVGWSSFGSSGMAHYHMVAHPVSDPSNAFEVRITTLHGEALVFLTRSGELKLIVTKDAPFTDLADGNAFRIVLQYKVSDGTSEVVTKVSLFIDGETGANPPVGADVKESGDVLDDDGNKVEEPGVPEVGGNLYSYADPSSLTVEVLQDDSEYGTFTLNELTGEWEYELDNTLEATQALKEGETVEQIFRIVVRADGLPDETYEIKVTIEGTNDLPAIAVAGAGRVDEDDLGGAAASLTDIPLNIAWAADDYDASGGLEGTISFDAVTSSAGTVDAPYGTSRGDVIKLFVSADGSIAVGYVGATPAAFDANGIPTDVRIVFTASVDPEGTGSYSFELHDTLDHPDAGSKDEITLRFDLLVTDDHGVAQPHSFSVVVDDDVPVPSDTPSSGVTVEESALADPIDWGSGNWTDILADLVAGGTAAASGTLANTVDFGADGAAANGGFVLKGNTGDLEVLALTSNGDDLQYATLDIGGQSLVLGFVSTISSSGLAAIFSVLEDVANGNIPNGLELLRAGLAVAGGGEFRMVFSLHTEGNGEYTFRLFDSLDHSGAEDTDLQIDFSSLFAAIDGDGDTIDLPAGTLTVTVVDDAPGLENLALRANSRVVHDETPGEQNVDDFSVAALFGGIDNPGDDPDVDSADKVAGALGFASSADTIAVFDALFGADGAGAGGGITYSLELNGVDGIDSGLTVTGGERILLYLETVNGVDMIVGRVESGAFAGDAAFAVTIRPDGTLATAQWLSLGHSGSGGNDTIRIDGDSILLRVTLTDGDDDSVSETLDISGRISFRDDGPTIADSVKVIVEENDLDNADPSAGHFSFSLFGQTLFDIDLIGGAAGSDPDGETDDADYRDQYPLVGGLLNTLLNGSVLASGSLAGAVDFGADGAAAAGGFVFNAGAPLDISGLTSGNEAVEYVTFSTPGGQNFVFGYVSTVNDDAVDAIFAGLEGLLGGSISSLLELAAALAGLPNNPDFRLVFSLATDASGAYEFRLFDNLDHDVLGDGEALTIDFSALFSAEDGDGDIVVLPDGTFTVELMDDAPVARGDSAILDEDTSFSGNVLANDTQGADGATLTKVSFDNGANWHTIAATGVTPITSPGVGDFTFQPDGGWSFVPAPDYNGTLTIPYTVHDRDGDSVTSEITVTITGTNDAPVFDPTIVEFALGFDDDANPLPGNLALVSAGSSPNTTFGGYSSQWTGDWTTQIKVWLDPDWADGEGFDWSVAASGTDGLHQRDFIFHVWKVDGQLYVAGSNNTDNQVNAGKMNGIANKIAVADEGWYTLEHRFVDDGGILKVELHLLDASGTSLWHETRTNVADTIGDAVGGNRYGWFVFASVADGVSVDGISLNLNGTEAHVVELADGHPDEGSGTHTVSGEIPFTDVDSLDAHTVSYTTPAPGVYLGTFTPVIEAGDEATGGNTGIVSWTFTIDDAAIEHLAAGETLTQVYTVEVRDNSGAANAADTIDVTITITGTNDAPVITGGNTGTVSESGDLALIDEAGLGGKLTHGYTLGGVANAALAAIKAGATDVAAFDAAFAAIQAITENEAATFAVFWEYLDANFNPGFVEGGNDPINAATARLGIAYALYLQGGGMPLVDVIAKFAPDADGNGTPDRAQSLHDNLLGNANGGVLTTRFSGDLLAELQGAAPAYLLARTWVSGYEDDAHIAAEMHADDMANGFARSTSGQLTAQDVDNGASWTFAVDDGTGAFTNASTGIYGTLTLDADGNWTYVLNDHDPDTQALAQGVPAEDTFTVQVKDEHGAATTETLTITVTGTNDAPVITGATSVPFPVSRLEGFVEAGPDGEFEPVIDLNDAISSARENWGEMAQILGAVRTAIGPNATEVQAIAYVWDYLDDLYVADGPDQTSINMAFTRLGIEYAKYLKSGGAPLIDVIAKYTPDGSDDGDAPDRIQTLHDNLLGNIENGALVQRYGNGTSAYNSLRAEVAAVDPDLLVRPYYSGNEGSSVTVQDARDWDVANGYVPATAGPDAAGKLIATDVDQPAGTPLQWSVNGTDSVTGTYGTFSIDPATGEWSYSVDPALDATKALAAGEPAEETFTVTVTDEHGATDTVTLTVTARGINDAPVIDADNSDLSGGVVESGLIPLVTNAGPNGGLSHGFTLDAATQTAMASLDTGAGADAFGQAYALVLDDADSDAGAIAVLWQYLDSRYPTIGGAQNHPVNEAFVRLGALYAELLVQGKIAPLTDVIAKYTADINGSGAPDRMQSLHDNLLGNLKGSVIDGRFNGELQDGLMALVDAIDGDTANAGSDAFLNRTAFDGNENGTSGTYDTGETYDAANGIVSRTGGKIIAVDADPGAVLTFTADHAGAYGTFAIDPDSGEWTYVLNQDAANGLAAGVTETEDFIVTVTDEHGASDRTTVTVTITGTNDAPMLVSGPVSGTVTEDIVDVNVPASLSVWGTLTYSDPDGPGSLDLADGWFAASFVSASAHGAGTVVSGELLVALENGNPNTHFWPYGAGGNSFYWDFAVDNSLVQYLNTGQSIEVVYEFAVADGAGATITQQVTITINGVDDNPPVITSGPWSETVVEDFSFTAPGDNLVINGDFEETNLDGWNVAVPGSEPEFAGGHAGGVGLRLASSGGQPFELSQMLDTVEGVKYTISFWVATSSNLYQERVNVSWNGESVLSQLVWTGGYDNFQHFTVDVIGTGGPSELLLGFETAYAVVLDDISVTAAPGTEHATGIIEFTDTNLDESHTVSYEPTDTGYVGTFAVKIVDDSTGDGSGQIRWTFSVDAAAIDHLGEGQSITQAYMVTVDDGNALHGGTDWQVVTVTIEGTNDAAVITGDVTGSVTEDGATVFTGNLDHTDVDGNNADDLWQAVTTQTASDDGYGTFTIDASGNWTYTLDNNHPNVQALGDGSTLTDRFTVLTEDGTAQTVEITINGTNDAPVVTSAQLSGSVTEEAVGSELVVNGGFNTDTAGWTIITTPDSVHYRTASGNPANGLGIRANSDVLPVLLNQDVPTVEGETYTISFWASGVLTPDTSNSLTVYWNGVPVLAESNVHDGASANLKHYTVEVVGGPGQASNLEFAFTGQYFWIIDDISVVSDLGLGVERTTGTIDFTDIDINDQHTVTASGSDDYLGVFTADFIDSATGDGQGTVVWTFSVNNAAIQHLGANDSIVQTYAVRIEDSAGEFAERQVSVTINGINDAPVVDAPIMDQVAAAGAVFSLDVAEAFDDVDEGDSLTLSATLADGSDLPDWLTFDPSTGMFSGTPGTADVGTIAVRVTATDESSVSVYDDFTIEVDAPNQAPTDIVFMGNRELSADWGTIGSLTGTAIPAGTTLFSMLGNDPDGDALTYRFGASGTQVSLGTTGNGSANRTFYLDDGDVSGGGAHPVVYGNYGGDPYAFTFTDARARDPEGEFIKEQVTLWLGRSAASGTADNDTMNGSSITHDQIMYGFGGNDTIRGGAGNDWIAGGAGNDTLRGGGGADWFVWTEGAGNNTAGFFSLHRDIIQDYDYAEGDTIDLQNLVPDIINGSAINYVRIVHIKHGDGTNSGALSIIVDTDGSALDFFTQTVYILENLNANSENKLKFYFDDQYWTISIASDGALSYTAVADPIILDLDGNGYAFDADVAFDLDGDGVKDKVAWNSSGDGILAFDRNGNGVIDDGTELFTPWFDGGDFATGGEALASLDANGDGVIDIDDPAFANLVIWRDENADGITDDGELTSLADNGITSISAPASPADGTVDGQAVIGEGTFTREDGSIGDYIEVALETVFGQTIAGTDGDDILAGGDGEDVLTGGKGADTFVVDDLDIADFITDYDFGEGDRIDLSALLDGIANTGDGVEGAVSKAFDGDTGETSIMIGDTAAVRLEGDYTGVDVSVLFTDDLGNQATAII